MTTTQQPTRPDWDAPTVFLPVSPLLGLEHSHRDIRADFEAALANFDAALAALGITVAPAAPIPTPQPHKRRWLR